MSLKTDKTELSDSSVLRVWPDIWAHPAASSCIAKMVQDLVEGLPRFIGHDVLVVDAGDDP